MLLFAVLAAFASGASQAAGVSDDRQVFEMVIPRDAKLGLDLKKGEVIGLMVYVGLENGATLALFEPWALFDCELR
ncbi:MAG: hypothetical protein AMXMBFR61_20920 [Fimbriimonadales bacterium]